VVRSSASRTNVLKIRLADGEVPADETRRGPSMARVEHTVCDSVEEMLAPSSLSRLLGTPIASVRVTPLQSNGFSANELFQVQAGDRRLVLKRLRSDDWLTRASRDDRCRPIAVWRTGLLDRLEPDLLHGVVAASRDGAHNALLMRDCTAGLHPGGAATDRRVDRILEALAVMHARFWGDDAIDDPGYELADVETLLTMSWPQSWPLMESNPEGLELVQKGWQALLDLVEPDIRVTIEQVMAHPGPLVDALTAEPATLLHGDYRLDNVAVMPDESVIAFDWQFAGHGPGVLDLAWLVMSGGVFELRGWAFDRYRDYLSDALGGALDVPRWERALAIAKFAEVLRKGNWHALFAVGGDEWAAYNRGYIAEYNRVVRQGAELL
jgi:hypothetical protein